MATGDISSRMAGLEYRVALLENLLAPQLEQVAAAQAKAAEAGVAAQAKAEAAQAEAEKKAAEEAELSDAAAKSKAAEDYLRELLAKAAKPAAG